MFSFLKRKPAPSPTRIEDSALFRIKQNGYGKFFVEEKSCIGYDCVYWRHVIGTALRGYDKLEHAEMALRQELEHRAKSVQKVVAYYV